MSEANQRCHAPKTIFCDIDGTLLKHTGDIISNNLNPSFILNNVLNSIIQWDKLNYKIILTTGRQESARKETEQRLAKVGIVYSLLIMGLPNGDRVLINDKKTKGVKNTAYAINLVRNQGLENVDINSKHITIPDKYLFSKIEKPWGYEELVECNDQYVVKKLFMKQGHSCSLQYHELKKETIVVLSGSLKILIGKAKSETVEIIDDKLYNCGDTVTIEPYTIHRMTAMEDTLYMETSTNQLWDVVRLEDNYNRIDSSAK